MHSLRFWVINIIGVTLVGLAGLQGWITEAYQADSSHLSVVIAGMLVWGLVACWRRLSWVKTAPKEPEFSGMTDDQKSVKIENQIGPIRTLANHEVLLGLVGTVVGLILAFKGLDAASIGDITLASEMLGSVIAGVSIALYTTLTGSLAYLWLFSQFKVLEHAAADMWLQNVSDKLREGSQKIYKNKPWGIADHTSKLGVVEPSDYDKEEALAMFGPVESPNAGFVDARGYVRGLRFQNRDEWRERVNTGVPMSNAKGKRIPPKPNAHYDEWAGWDDWLGITK